jgi:hypothetical protein
MKERKNIFINAFFLIFLFIFIGGIASIGNYASKQHYLLNDGYQSEKVDYPLAEKDNRLLETKIRVEEEAVDRFFLSEVVSIDNHYVPTIHSCLFDRNGEPLFPLYIYNHFSSLGYPQKPPYDVILIRYRLLPEDNLLFHPEKKCYIQEIKSDSDWTKVEKQYNFSRDLFI